MKQFLIRLKEDEHRYVSKEADAREISMSEYIRLLIRMNMGDEAIRNKSVGKLYWLKLPIDERKKMIRESLKKEKRNGPLESFIEFILNKNPRATTDHIGKAIIRRFNVPMTRKYAKMIRRKKKSMNEKLRRFRLENEAEKG